MKRIVAPLILAGMLPLTTLLATACTGNASTQDSAQSSTQNSDTSSTAASGTTQSDMAQMDHSQMDHGSTTPPDANAPMQHGDMSMNLGPADASFDLRFIDAMTLHHQGAIDMSNEALQKSDRPEIKTLAEDIIAAQEEEIAQLQQWRQSWYADAGSEPMMYHAEMNGMMPMTEDMKSSMMMAGDLGAADDQFDLRFINAMIPHHEGAVVMAQEALEKSTRPEVKELAQAMIDAQQPEIEQMQQWRQQWYGQ